MKLHSGTVSFKLKLSLLECHQVYIGSTSRFSRRKRVVVVVVVVYGGGGFVVVCFFIYSRLILFARDVFP